MTAIAWAIMFIGLIFYGAIYDEKLEKLNLNKSLGSFTLFTFVILAICTIRELMR